MYETCWHLIRCMYGDNENCITIWNVEMKDYDGNKISVNDMAWDNGDSIFITDPKTSHVHIYDLAGIYKGEVTVENGSFDCPQGIVYDASSSLLYVGQNQGQIIAYENAKIETNYQLQFTL